MKRVLIITTAFPPQPTVGRHRSVKFAKHLPEFGWEPVILTVDDRYLLDRDDDTLKELPADLQVHRAFFLPDPLQSVRKIVHRSTLPSETQESSLDSRQKSRPSLPKRAFNAAMKTYWSWGRRYLCIPDQHITWLPFALAKAFQIHRKEPFDVVMTTAPNYTTFIVGWCIKRLTGKPWIVDFRDLWTGDYHRLWVPSWRARLESWLERTILRRADHLITVTLRMSEFVRSLHAGFPPGRIHVITNGYDDEDLPNVKAITSPGDPFTITYTGKLDSHRPAKHFLCAVGELLNERASYKQTMRLNFFGKVHPDEQQNLQSVIDKYHLAPIVNFVPYIKYKEALLAQATSTVNLLILDHSSHNCDLVIPAKTYEYLAAGRPILAIVPEGDCKQIILDSQAGITCDPLDVKGIKEALRSLIEKHLKGELSFRPDPEVLSRYHRRELTGQLARILDREVIGPP
ncbi:MAG: glycosyltransferase family 4 protein [bacterium]|nr:glycosyltransferase family 4 protein [bacterium]